MAVDLINKATGTKWGGRITAILTIVAIIGIVIVLTKIYKATRKGSSIVGEQLGDQVLSVQTGVSAARIQYIRDEATYLWQNGVINPGWLWPSYDYRESYFISAINKMANTIELAMLNNFFKANHTNGTSLKGVINDSFNSADKNQLNQSYLTFINTNF